MFLNKRINNKNIKKFSGIFLVIPLILNVYYYGFESELISSFIYAVLFIMFGFVDDLVEFNVLEKMLILIILSISYIYNTDIIDNIYLNYSYSIHLGEIPGFIFTLLCFLLLLNATNYIDGIDGLLLTISIISIIFIFILISLKYSFFFITFIVFLFFLLLLNVKAFSFLPKLILGDAGSLGIGFILSFILIFFTQNERILNESAAIWGVSFIVYEFLTINIIRIIYKKNIFKRDLNFIFNLLKNDYGLIKTLIICNLINIFFCLIGLFIFFTKLHLLSYILFILFFFIYLSIRLRLNSIAK